MKIEKNNKIINIRTSAPLPFIGQKRNAIKKLYEFLNDKDISTKVVDVYGGSGLLSNFFKKMYEEKEVVYNDYDNYIDRLNDIEKTNMLLQEIREIVNKHNIAKAKRIPVECTKEIDKVKEKYKPYDEITINTNLYFANFAGKKKKSTYYNNVGKNGYKFDKSYLQGCKIIHKDCWEILKHIEKNTLYILDPPYPSTEQDAYSNDFNIIDNEKLLKKMEEMDEFIYFSALRSPANWFFLNKNFKNIYEIDITGLNSSKFGAKKRDERAYIKLKE